MRDCARFVLVVLTFAALGSAGCGGDEPAPGPSGADDVSTGGDDIAAQPDINSEVSLDVLAADVPQPADSSGDSSDNPGEPPDVPDVPEPPAPFATPFASWLPAVVGDVLATVDGRGLSFQLVGGLPIEVTTFTLDEVPTSPVAIESGLLCWDLNNNLLLDLAEDLDFDAKGTAKDCALHPIPSAGRAGFMLAVNHVTAADPVEGGDTTGPAAPLAGCQLRAYTTTGAPAWTADFTGTCQAPTRVEDFALLPITAGATGILRLVDTRSGAVTSQITLAGTPTTPAAYVGDGRYAIGLDGGIAIVGATTGGGTGLFLNGSADTTPDRPTALARSGPSQLAVVVRGIGDGPGALGTAVRLFTLGASPAELPFALEPPGPIWAPPVTALLGQKWFLAVGGAGWVRVFNPSTGSTVRSVAIEGTTSALSWGADGRVHGVSWDWDGNTALRGGRHWTSWSFDPGNAEALEVHEEGDAPLAIRSISSPAVLCDVAVVQLFLDAAVPSTYEVYKPCAGSLAPGGFARPAGDNGNSGVLAGLPNCASGPGVVPCEATGGCSVNTDCDDNNACTVDSCVKDQCSYKFLPGCCSTDSQCDDFDPCTENRCISGKCQYPTGAKCCESSSDCDDLNACTKDACESGTCEYSVVKEIEGCCSSDLECLVNIPCVEGTCNLEKSTCQAIYTENCCNKDADCDDGNVCTLDTCVDGLCAFAPNPEEFGCCESDTDCNTGNICILGICNSNNATCEITPVPECCLTNVQCDDKNACTKDLCTDQTCEHPLDPTPKGCCDTDSDCEVEITECILSFFCAVDLATCQQETKNCDDMDDCTQDYCEEGECFNKEIPGCCSEDLECDDGAPCTADTCDPELNVCKNEESNGCCVTDADCEDGNPTTTETCVAHACVVHKCEDHPFTSTTLPLDLVVVVDQSTSMNDELPLVRKYLNDLATWLGTAGIDYRVSLIATRKKGVNQLCIDPPLAGPNCENSAVFRQVDEQVASHNALVMVMSHIDELEAFMRPVSSRQFVVFSDDVSDVTDEAFTFFLANRPGYENWAFHAFVGFDGNSCALEAGQDYIDLAVQSGGVRYDICTTSWTNSYPQLGQVAEDAGTSFALSQFPLLGTVTVSYDGAALANGVAYTYDPATNRVQLLDPLPATGKVLQICFDANLGGGPAGGGEAPGGGGPPPGPPSPP